MKYAILGYRLKDSLDFGDEAYSDPGTGQNWAAKLADFMALSSHDQTGAPFVTWMLSNSILES